MYSLLSSFDILHWLLFGMSAAVLGLFSLLAGPLLPQTMARKVSFAVLTTLGVLAGAAYCLDQPHATVALGACFALWTVGTVLRADAFRSASHTSIRWVAHPRFQAALLLALAPASVGMAMYVEQAELQSVDLLGEDFEAPPVLAELHGVGYSDQDQPLMLWYAAEPAKPNATEREHTFLQRPNLHERVIRTGPANIETNCHGWVFTAGQYWVKGEVVPKILTDNGYKEVSQPQENDIVIYRDESGNVAHTALVRMVAADGKILLESKWGQYGRFLHAPNDQPYGTNYSYYHSARRGHVLRGLDKGYKPSPVTAPG